MQNRSIFSGRGCRLLLVPSSNPVSSTITLLRHHLFYKKGSGKSPTYILHPPNHLISADIDGITGRVATLFRYSERFKYLQCNIGTSLASYVLKQRKYLQCKVLHWAASQREGVEATMLIYSKPSPHFFAGQVKSYTSLQGEHLEWRVFK